MSLRPAGAALLFTVVAACSPGEQGPPAVSETDKPAPEATSGVTPESATGVTPESATGVTPAVTSEGATGIVSEADAPPAPETLAPPTGPLEIRITGEDYRWLLVYTGPDGEFDTADDVHTQRHLHLPARREISIELDSADFVYTFYVPQLDIMEAAVPGQPFVIDVETGSPASYDLLGSQMCGYTHQELLGNVMVQQDSEFSAWSDRLAN